MIDGDCAACAHPFPPPVGRPFVLVHGRAIRPIAAGHEVKEARLCPWCVPGFPRRDEGIAVI